MASSRRNYKLNIAHITRIVFLSTILLLLQRPLSLIQAKKQDLYKTLNVPKSASQKDITKAYRKLALKHHPDKVSESEREKSEKIFKEIGNAHDVLSDEEKRKSYDTYGEQGLDANFQPGFSNTGASGGSPFGGNRQAFSFGGRPQGGNDVGIDLSDILQQFMGQSPGGGFGGMNNMGGMGGMNMGMGGSQSHRPTYGSGQQQEQQMKPQTKEFYCTLGELSDFHGCSKKLKVTMPSTDPMTGEQRHTEKIYTIDVQPGWKEGTKIRFKASKDGFPPMTFVLKEKKHKYIKRRGDDLVYKCIVTSRQAEIGAKLKIPLPDGEVLEVKTDPDEIYEKYVKRVSGKGMPIRGPEIGLKKRGDFLIEFRIREQSESRH